MLGPHTASIWRVVLLAVAAAWVTGCTSIQGYPDDPLASAQSMTALQQRYLSPTSDAAYHASTDSATRARLRNDIVYGRVLYYDLEFSLFQRSLNRSANSINTGGDIIAIGLGVAGAVVGGAATKSVLAASSAGVVGVQGAINKDLFFQQTIPALIAQMSANRDELKASIYSNLQKSDDDYPLMRATIDLRALSDAGSIPAAISIVTRTADAAKAAAQAKVLDVTYNANLSSTGQQLTSYLRPNGVTSPSRMLAFNKWLAANYPNDNLAGADVERNNGTAPTSNTPYETIRAKALADKSWQTN